MKYFQYYIIIFLIVGGCKTSEYDNLISAFQRNIHNNILKSWYPKAIDQFNHSFLSSFDQDFNPTGAQDKMIHSQAKHLWITADAAMKSPEYKVYADNGFRYLANHLWDSEDGGFYTLKDQAGILNGDKLKLTEGNAYGILAAVHYYKMSQDTAALNLAIRAFNWLELHGHDGIHKGYFAQFDKAGNPVFRNKDLLSTSEIGYKSFKGSIQILEAFVELFQVWANPTLKTRIDEMFLLLRDTIIDKKGNVNHFFESNWTPVSFKDTTKQIQVDHSHLDHVSFGDNLFAARILMEVSQSLVYKNDSNTINRSKFIIDRSIQKGMDQVEAGFYDEAIYIKGQNDMSIIQGTKNWVIQARALHTLLVASTFFSNDAMNYYEKFLKQWNYINKYLIDHKNGDWFDSGLDKDPYATIRPKGTLLKEGFEQYKALQNCLNILSNLKK